MEYILGLGMALPIASSTAISVVTGVAQGVSEQQKRNADASNQTRMLKFHVDVGVDAAQRKGRGGAELRDTMLTLRHGKVWVERRSAATRQPEAAGHHPFTGFYLEYPDDARGFCRGLVSTISVDPPMLNWIYVDKDTHEVKYAARSGSIMHHVGDYDWTTDAHEDSCITLDGFEGFVAVQEDQDEADGAWALYFDMDDDGLKSKKKGRRTVEVHLQRRIIVGQELNKWGLKEEGNIGFKKTREV